MTNKIPKSGAVGMVLTAVVLAAGGQCVARAQQAAKPEPEYVGTVYWCDAAANKLNLLQRQKLNTAAKTRAFGFGGAKGMYQADGPKSNVRFTADQQLEFVFQAPQNVDPQTLIQIVRFVEKKDHRELIQIQAGGLFHPGVKSEGEKASVAFQAKKYSASSIEISPAEPLQPGEYAVRSPNTLDVYCFGIDPPPAR